MTNDDKIYEKLLYLRNQGRLNSGQFFCPQLGMNFRMTDLQCAVGVAHMISKISMTQFGYAALIVCGFPFAALWILSMPFRHGTYRGLL